MKVKVFNKGFINNLFSAVVCDCAKWVYEGKSSYADNAIDKDTLAIFIMNHLYQLEIPYDLIVAYRLVDEMEENGIIYYVGCCDSMKVYQVQGIV